MSGDGFSCEFKDDPSIGENNFQRSVPPGDQYLYRLKMTVKSSSGVDYTCFDGKLSLSLVMKQK